MIVQRIDPSPTPRQALAAFAGAVDPFLLESVERDDVVGRYSFAGIEPFMTVSARGNRVEIVRDGRTEVHVRDPLEALRALLAEIPRVELAAIPLAGGAVGFLAYDLARCVECLPERTEDDLGLPDLSFAFYDALVAWNHVTGETSLVSTGLPLRGAAAERRAQERADAIRARLETIPTSPGVTSEAPTKPLASTFSRPDYLRAVKRAKEYIAAGDILQVNLSQRFTTECSVPGPRLYSRLAEANPASFAAYLASPCGADVISASPERFLLLEDGTVETRPIKGTRPRGDTPDEDERLARELLASEKDRAELAMIVDLMRSDVGHVAQFGSVAVREFAALTTHPTVHHLHGTVVARLAENRDAIDLVRASFPGGSITGAPKVRAMEIIEEMEPVRRGAYTGSIGYFSFSGRVDLNIAIRTLVRKDGRVTFSVGGGIVADSDPEREYDETLHKGRGLARSLGLEL